MMSSSSSAQSGRVSIPVSVLMYREAGRCDARDAMEELAVAGLAAEEVEMRVAAARAEARAETELRMRCERDEAVGAEAEKVRRTIAAFGDERKAYFVRVESDVVHLAMAIAAKILHREAQVDRMLVAGLVRVAIEKLHEGSSVSVRVPLGEAERWRRVLAEPLNGSAITVIEDANLAAEDCVLETELGAANFGVEAQLKEVEQGFFDLLAHRPAIK